MGKLLKITKMGFSNIKNYTLLLTLIRQKHFHLVFPFITRKVKQRYLGTEGFIEIRKNVDIGGREGGNHLFLVDQKETKYIDCSKVPLPFGENFVNDILNRTETAMSQEHCLLATELALKAQKFARIIKS